MARPAQFPPQAGIGISQLIPHASSECTDLLTKTLRYDYNERITAREAMRHPYFRDMRESEARRSKPKKESASNRDDDGGVKESARGRGGNDNNDGKTNSNRKELPSMVSVYIYIYIYFFFFRLRNHPKTTRSI